MNFTLPKSIEILERTPGVLRYLLQGLSQDWTSTNEGGDSWNAYDVVGHLIYGEKTDWIPRAEIILSDKTDKNFVPFDRFAQFTESKGKTLGQLLDEFGAVRNANISKLKSWNLSEADLGKKGNHPAFGAVTLRQLLATWAIHDLNHLAQVSRVMAKHYKEDVGPWIAYLKVLNT